MKAAIILKEKGFKNVYNGGAWPDLEKIIISKKNNMIEIFKTNLMEVCDTKAITQKLLEHLQLSKINFDLEDCDKILRIESEFIDIPKVISILNENEFYCEILI